MILNAIRETKQRARESQRLLYLYFNGQYTITPTYESDWLYKAYPGGRNQLSPRGKKKLEEEGYEM